MSGSAFDQSGMPGAFPFSPLTMALLGAGQAMGQASAPSRLPAGIGSVLGAGGGGFGQGAMAAQQGQHMALQNQAQWLNNQFLQASMPTKLALLNGGSPGGQGSSGNVPFGVPNSMASSGGGVNRTPVSLGGNTPDYLLSPDELARWGKYALATGQDTAGARIFGLLDSMAGAGHAFNRQGTAFQIPGSVGDPGDIFQREQATKQAGVNPALQQHLGETQQNVAADWAKPHVVGASDTMMVPGMMGGMLPGNNPYMPTGQNTGQGGGSNPLINALNSLPEKTSQGVNLRNMASFAASAAGLPPDAIPYWLSTLHQESGGFWHDPKGVPDSNKGAIGFGQVMPFWAPKLGLQSPDQLRDPMINLIASAKIFGQGLQQAQGNPRGALATYYGADDPAYYTPILSRVQQWGGAEQRPQQAQGAGSQPQPGQERGAAGETPTTSGSPFVVGDSLATGISLAGKYKNSTRPGAAPDVVLRNIQALPDAQIAGKNVVLSGGASNNPAQTALVEQQVAALKQKGAANVTIVGVGDRSDLAPVNATLQQIAQRTGSNFAPVDPTTLSQDRVHPRNYNPLARSVGAFAITPQQAAVQPGQDQQQAQPNIAQAATGGAPAQTPQGLPPGVLYQGPKAALTPGQEESQKKIAELSESQVPEILTQAKESQVALQRIAMLRNTMQKAYDAGLPPGYFSPELARAAAGAKSLGIDLSAIGINKEAIGNQQAANEAITIIAGEMLKRLFPQRITNMDIKLFGPALLHYGMDPAALDQILTQAENAAKYDVTKANDLFAYKAAHGHSAMGWDEQFYPKAGYGPQFFDALKSAEGNAQQNAAPTGPQEPTKISSMPPPGTNRGADQGALSIRPTTRAEVEALPPGTKFIWTDNRIHTRKATPAPSPQTPDQEIWQ